MKIMLFNSFVLNVLFCFFFCFYTLHPYSAEKRAAWRQARLKSLEQEHANTDASDNKEVGFKLIYAWFISTQKSQ